MGRRQRKRRGTDADGNGPARPGLVPWRERAREILGRLRAFAREARGPELEDYLHLRFGEDAKDTAVEDLQLAFDEFVCAPGSAGDQRSLVRAFAEETEDLTADERSQLPTWEQERSRRVYLLDRAHRDRLELWDPVTGGRAFVQLVEKMGPGRVAALGRGIVVVLASVPFGTRRISMGHVETYEEPQALEMYRREVREGGRTWHDLPPATPV